ncbi:DNA mismatch endonuclease Vsr [Streptomyces sp. NPDC050658]|uniref:DNA mismatch endonuclease Vsr n=1 Tax=unclassified Streptomyces TaxID=2593676 RepID=UPI003426A069
MTPRHQVELATCMVCHEDSDFLRRAERPTYETLERPVRVVDLFSGGGGLSLGAAEAARRVGRGTTIALAVEYDQSAADVYALNFPDADLRQEDVSGLFDGELKTRPTRTERALAQTLGHVDVLVAGPPCQGHSNLNNHTRRQDPRNALYLRAVRAVEILKPTFVLIENVPAVQHDKGKVLDKAVDALEMSGYTVAGAVLDFVRFGVPQRRRRHILLAVRGQQVDPKVLLETRSPCDDHDERSVKWAIGDLLGVIAETGPDSPSKPTAENQARMDWLHAEQGRVDLPNSMRPTCHRDKAHTYKSMYGRLSWGQPAQTMTSGFGSMGQGRFVHPGLPRTLTPHEAARLQTLPDFYDLDTSKKRGAWAKVIGNAVPPLLGVHLIEPLLCALPATDDHRTAVEAAPKQARPSVSTRPPASSELIRVRMTNTKRRDTKPELALRSALHSMGLRFKVDLAVEGNRRIDVAFPTERVAVYVDGCFWHACPVHGTTPKQNREWWATKLAANKARDLAATEDLEAAGWLVLRFWEHDAPITAAEKVCEQIKLIRASGTGKRRGSRHRSVA